MPSIELYVIRHGLAGERGTYANDDERPLTEEGRTKTKRVAKRLHELGVQFDLLQTSPLVRAYQTAEILRSVGLSKQLEVSEYLAPAGDFDAWVDGLQQWRKGRTQLAIVGHEPDLGEWTERLLWGTVRHQLIIKKAGVIGLVLPEDGSPIGRSQLFWFTPPKYLL
ncbi:phosphohistidine phosphatase SixA [Phormidium tenue FACHB-886]|nr:phosphohistidine phosphatase SixA [Phormidium tenue FACHB-886]